MVDRQTIDAKILSRMFLAGAKNLEAKKEWINELNVFPVPDGDTGTNMTLTIMSAASEVGASYRSGYGIPGKGNFSGSLRGARGNPVLSCHSFCVDLPEVCVNLQIWMHLPLPQLWSEALKLHTKQL